MQHDRLLNELLAETVERYGPRGNPGLDIAPVQVDRSSFPETLRVGAALEVHVTFLTSGNALETLYELAHEAVHVLMGEARRDTVVFEEGLANHHALNMKGLPRKWRRGAEAKLPPALRGPLTAFERLKPSDEKIKAVRALAPEIGALTPDMVQAVFQVPQSAAEAVCRRMTLTRPANM